MIASPFSAWLWSYYLRSLTEDYVCNIVNIAFSWCGFNAWWYRARIFWFRVPRLHRASTRHCYQSWCDDIVSLLFLNIFNWATYFDINIILFLLQGAWFIDILADWGDGDRQANHQRAFQLVMCFINMMVILGFSFVSLKKLPCWIQSRDYRP